MQRQILIALALAVAAGCDTTVTKQEMETANYGPAPVSYQDEIKSYRRWRERKGGC